MGLAVKKNLGWLGHRDEILPSYIGIIIRHEIRIPIKQPVYYWSKVSMGVSYSDLTRPGPTKM